MSSGGKVLPLNAREQRVVDLYVQSGGAVSKHGAYKTEYHSHKKASQFWDRHAVKEYLESVQLEARERSTLTLERAMQEVASVAFANVKGFYMDEYMDNDGNLQLHLLPDFMAAAIKEIDVATRGRGDKRMIVTKIKMHDKNPALDKILRFLGAYSADNNQRNPSDALTNLIEHISEQGMPKPGQMKIVNG